jgi:hypothetical protein
MLNIILFLIWLLPTVIAAIIAVKHENKMKFEYDIKLKSMGEDLAILKAVVKDMKRELDFKL